MIVSKKAIIDIDNTLWQFSDALYLELKKLNSNCSTPDQWCNFNVWEQYCSFEDFIAIINMIHHNQDSEQYRPYPEAQKFLTTLKNNGFQVIIASHRTPETAAPTERWLVRHGLPYDELHLSYDKTILFPEADIVVDDLPRTLEKAVKNGIPAAGLLFPWNKEYAGCGFELFGTLDEVLEFILVSS
ncbi:MAG: hypothetical protein M0P57_10845 [Syntrophales bacterium]|jgi:FMN phosphatase YigB (HAD superfamily)|nr:hypothetical protein [Syntrophales bacterium]MDY0043084.1 hypothetical protein [Syntrophales bacterium]